ncbi:competence protein ComEA [Sedimentibacter acidaminivorans]|uniref:Competence protein ComEA n=1 Tax=Sedimentibacter acidaminivorans TaxID=913099 RepID=A0ABS4GBB4_9FIRM|nr:ComEA family DNA-binding protein [Sedimentibacter acidaminivorans]MBP1924966.1 competence protein ComEA [Sedimentibacter acidaminivorans]
MNNGIYKKGLAVVLTITIIILTAIGVKLSSKEKEINDIIYYDPEGVEEAEKVIFNDDVDTKKKKDIIVVDIDGAVENPGVYEFSEGDRVNVAIKRAGGLLDTAYTKKLNKARLLVDGEKIYILEESEINSDVVITDDSIYNTEEMGNKININTASKEMLMSLDGIGEVYSQRIIEYRDKIKFTSIEDIEKIKGIGEKTFNSIKDKITVD